MSSNRFLVLFLLLTWVPVGYAQSAWPPCEAPHDGLLQDGKLAYNVVEPANVQPNTPIAVMIHGLGHDKDRFEGFARLFNLPFRMVLPNAPRHYKKDGFSWYRVRCQGAVGDVIDSTKRLLQLIDAVQERWPQAGKPFVVGFSQGGVMGMSLAARYPGRVAGVVALSGYLVPLNLSLPKAGKHSPPLFIAHGRGDPVVAFAEGEGAVARFRKAGYDVEFRPHPRRHAVPQEVVADGAAWLIRRAKARRVRHESPRTNR